MEPTDQPTNPASGVQVTDVVDATVVKAHVTTTASIEQDNAVKSPSPHEAPSPSSPSPETLLTAQIEQDVQGAIEPITGGVSTVIGMATAHIDPDLVDEPAVALAGAKSAVSRLHTMIHNIGNVAETLLTAQIEQDVQGAIEPITGGVSTVIGMATAHIDPDLVDEPAVALAGAKSAVSRLHTMIHNIGNVAEMPYEGLKALFGDLGKFLSKL